MPSNTLQPTSSEAQLLEMVFDRDKQIAQAASGDSESQGPSQAFSSDSPQSLSTYKELFGMVRDRGEMIDQLEQDLARKDLDASEDHYHLTTQLATTESRLKCMKRKYAAALKREKRLHRRLTGSQERSTERSPR